MFHSLKNLEPTNISKAFNSILYELDNNIPIIEDGINNLYINKYLTQSESLDTIDKIKEHIFEFKNFFKTLSTETNKNPNFNPQTEIINFVNNSKYLKTTSLDKEQDNIHNFTKIICKSLYKLFEPVFLKEQSEAFYKLALLDIIPLDNKGVKDSIHNSMTPNTTLDETLMVIHSYFNSLSSDNSFCHVKNEPLKKPKFK